MLFLLCFILIYSFIFQVKKREARPLFVSVSIKSRTMGELKEGAPTDTCAIQDAFADVHTMPVYWDMRMRQNKVINLQCAHGSFCKAVGWF